MLSSTYGLRHVPNWIAMASREPAWMNESFGRVLSMSFRAGVCLVPVTRLSFVNFTHLFHAPGSLMLESMAEWQYMGSHFCVSTNVVRVLFMGAVQVSLRR